MAAEKNRPARTVVRGKLRIVNQPVSKVDAHALVTGKAVYTNDLAPADCLIVKVLRSPYAHALIKDINTSLGITAVIITHEMSVIEKICSQVAILGKGSVVESGAVEDVFFHPKTDFARRLVLPEPLQNMPQDRLYRLIFNGRSSYEPVIANMVLECGCPVNIMYADTRDLNGVAYGQMVLQLPDRKESIERIMAYARAHSIMLEEMSHV